METLSTVFSTMNENLIPAVRRPKQQKRDSKETRVGLKDRGRNPKEAFTAGLFLWNHMVPALWLLQPGDFAFVLFGRITLNIQSDKELCVERKQSTSSIYLAPRGSRQSPNIICAFKQCIDDRLSTFNAVILSRFLQVLLLFVFKMPSVCFSDVHMSGQWVE